MLSALRVCLPLPQCSIFRDHRIACSLYIRNELRKVHPGVSKPTAISQRRAGGDSIKSREVPYFALPILAHPSRSSPIIFIHFSSDCMNNPDIGLPRRNICFSHMYL